jgi:hypothetical protein
MHTHLASSQDPRTNILTVAYTVPRSAVQLGCILVSEGHTTVPADLFGPPEVRTATLQLATVAYQHNQSNCLAVPSSKAPCTVTRDT